jgi:hypothetical protein
MLRDAVASCVGGLVVDVIQVGDGSELVGDFPGRDNVAEIVSWSR